MTEPDVSEAAPGVVFGNRYRLDAVIGSGGMAQVWEATDLVLSRSVAVKLMHPHLMTDAALARFRQEAITSARLTHPNIVSVYDTFSNKGFEGIVMELIHGITLRHRLDEHGPLPIPEATRVGTAVCEALGAAHERGLVHRDVKPANVLLCDDGRVKITDFGIAKGKSDSDLTQEGTLVGTAAYLSPEQLTGKGIDGRSDLYSLGLVLFEATTGELPFTGETDVALAVARLHQPAPDLSRYLGAEGQGLAAAVNRSLHRDPDRRWSTAADFRRALLAPVPAHIQVGEVGDDEADTQHFDTPLTMRRRRWVAPTVVSVLVGISVLVLLALFAGPGRAPDPTATTTTATIETPSQQLRLVTAFAYDPRPGDGSEQNSRLGNTIDQDPTTEWRTETYDNGDLQRLKKGIGIYWTLDAEARLDTLQVATSTPGWSADVYVLTDATSLPREGGPAGVPVDTVTAKGTTVTANLKGTRGSAVLLWLTELPPNPPFQIRLGTTTLTGWPES